MKREKIRKKGCTRKRVSHRRGGKSATRRIRLRAQAWKKKNNGQAPRSSAKMRTALPAVKREKTTAVGQGSDLYTLKGGPGEKRKAPERRAPHERSGFRATLRPRQESGRNCSTSRKKRRGRYGRGGGLRKRGCSVPRPTRKRGASCRGKRSTATDFDSG